MSILKSRKKDKEKKMVLGFYSSHLSPPPAEITPQKHEFPRIPAIPYKAITRGKFSMIGSIMTISIAIEVKINDTIDPITEMIPVKIVIMRITRNQLAKPFPADPEACPTTMLAIRYGINQMKSVAIPLRRVMTLTIMLNGVRINPKPAAPTVPTCV